MLRGGVLCFAVALRGFDLELTRRKWSVCGCGGRDGVLLKRNKRV